MRRPLLDLDVTPAQQYLVTPDGQRYRKFVDGGFHWAQIDFGKGSSKDRDNGHRMVNQRVERPANANAVGSQIEYGLHCPVLDIDVPALLVPSSTVDHSHLYIRKPMPWHHYSMLLQTLSYVGILEEGYVGASLARQETFVRTPWTRK
jgi:hypothetical protein